MLDHSVPVLVGGIRSNFETPKAEVREHVGEPGPKRGSLQYRLAWRHDGYIGGKDVECGLEISGVDGCDVLRADSIHGILQGGRRSSVCRRRIRLLWQRPEDVDSIFRRHGHEFRHVWRSRRWLTHLRHELVEAAGCTEKQHACGRVAEHLETVRNVARPEDVRARPGDRPVTVAHEGHVTLEDIERFVLEMVRMVRRGKPRWHQILHESECAVGRLPCRSEYGWKSQKVNR